VEQLLAFSRKQMVEPKILDVNAAIQDTEKMLRRLIGEDIEFSTRLDGAAGSVRVDPAQLDQLIMNLTVNARDAMPSGGSLAISTAAVEVGHASEPPVTGMPPGRYALIEARDTGIGMSPETRSHIFEPFFTTKPVGKGTGLGLSTVYGIVQQSGGFIAVESAPGVGSAFRIYLPSADDGVAAAVHPAPETGRTGGQEAILVAEDEDAVRAMIVETLEERGYKVLEARQGRHALDVAAGHPGRIDLLLTDIVMPQMGGPELWSQLASRYPQMRVVYISGHTDRELDPSVPILKKPFAPDRLAAMVRETLDG
jgi:two-component system, cell cycle sensor histidine kinase and response regulator CckA